MFKAIILADSTHSGNRLVTFELEYPRYIHSELLMHREFSRNSQSTRAIPTEKMINSLTLSSIVEPSFMMNCKGMSPDTPLTGEPLKDARLAWKHGRESAVRTAKELINLGVHKQIAGRVLEPYSTIKTILSSTAFDNFFNLRLAPQAQQEIQLLARLMKDKLDTSTSRRVDLMYIHLPLISPCERVSYEDSILKKISVARCARVSYLNHLGERDIDDDIRLYDKLLLSRHASAFEHVATPMSGRFGNFTGWRQHRQEVGL